MSTLRRILKDDLNLKPYHITRKQELQQQDFQTRMDWANWYLGQLRTDPYFEDEIWWTDESHCQLTGYVNSNNAVHWGSQRPERVVGKPHHAIKVTVWCAISVHGVLGPYFFEENGRTVTVNGTRYLDMLQNSFYPDLSQFSLDNDGLTHNWHFMQDGARPHITRGVRNFLSSKFDTRTIGQYLGTHWPARSPDLTPCDFFLWGWVKDQLYQRYPLTGRHALKTAVTDIVRTIPVDYCRNACRGVKKRCEQLLAVQGRQFEQLR